jgi:hypothetical protein
MFGECEPRVTGIPSPILRSDIDNPSLGTLGFDLEGSYKCVFRLDANMTRFAT